MRTNQSIIQKQTIYTYRICAPINNPLQLLNSPRQKQILIIIITTNNVNRLIRKPNSSTSEKNTVTP
jgi:site-specific recombinase XerD